MSQWRNIVNLDCCSVSDKTAQSKQRNNTHFSLSTFSQWNLISGGRFVETQLNPNSFNSPPYNTFSIVPKKTLKTPKNGPKLLQKILMTPCLCLSINRSLPAPDKPEASLSGPSTVAGGEVRLFTCSSPGVGDIAWSITGEEGTGIQHQQPTTTQNSYGVESALEVKICKE